MSNLSEKFIAMKIGYHPISKSIADFQHVSLYDIVKSNSKTQFLSGGTKFCYHLNYTTMAFGAASARENYGDNVVQNYKDSYVKQQMHSVSGERNDLCMYTYSPEELKQFLHNNKHNHYTYLPLTIHATESANFIRHDMLIIFDNQQHQFYLFDCKNRNDFLPRSDKLPRDVFDCFLLFFQTHPSVNIGYAYQTMESWEPSSTFHPYGVGSLDFVISTAWCYHLLMSLELYDSPTGYATVIDDMHECDRFHMIYCAMLDLIGVNKYRNSVPLNAQADLTSEEIKPIGNEVQMGKVATNVVIPHISERTDNAEDKPVDETRLNERKLNNDHGFDVNGIKYDNENYPFTCYELDKKHRSSFRNHTLNNETKSLMSAHHEENKRYADDHYDDILGHHDDEDDQMVVLDDDDRLHDVELKTHSNNSSLALKNAVADCLNQIDQKMSKIANSEQLNWSSATTPPSTGNFPTRDTAHNIYEHKSYKDDVVGRSTVSRGDFYSDDTNNLQPILQITCSHPLDSIMSNMSNNNASNNNVTDNNSDSSEQLRRRKSSFNVTKTFNANDLYNMSSSSSSNTTQDTSSSSTSGMKPMPMTTSVDKKKEKNDDCLIM